jgi:hypothetical protein
MNHDGELVFTMSLLQPCWLFCRLMASLVLRCWFAAEVANHSSLLSRVCNPSSETGQVACEWRQAIVMALWATVTSAEDLPSGHPDLAYQGVLRAVKEQVASAVAAGPYGAGARGVGQRSTVQHHVATLT